MTLCPVCGFELGYSPWSEGVPVDKPCPSCGIHFGHDDIVEAQRDAVYRSWRMRWVSDGKRWWSQKPQPPEFNPDEQLARLPAE